MVATEISGSFIVRDKKILMIFDEEKDGWKVPSGTGKSGELGACTAERVAEEATECSSETLKYKKRLKTVFTEEGQEYMWQPYTVELDGEPENGEWVSLDEIESKKLATPLESIKEKIVKRL